MNSIRGRLTLLLTLALAALFTACGALVWLLARESLMDQFDTALLTRARALSSSIDEEDGALEFDLDEKKNAPPRTESEENKAGFLFEVRNDAGAVLLRAPALGDHALPSVPPPAGWEPEFYDMEMPDGGPGRAVVLRFNADDDKRGLFRGIILVLLRSAAEPRSEARMLLLVLGGTGAGALLLLPWLVRAALRRGLRPLETLAARTASIDARKLDTRLPSEECPDELRPVVATLNALLARLEESFARERRFSSDVAHELRTPVAELKSLAELAVTWPEHATPEAFGEVLAVAGEMEETVSRLTLLGRAEAGVQPVQTAPADLREIIRDALHRLEPEGGRRGLRYEIRLAPLTLETDAALWRMIATNLIGNATHHAPPGSTVRVTLTDAFFKVDNPAPDLTPADMERIFDRFWRKDAARSSRGHSGLGLELTRTLCHLLNHELEARLTPEGVFEITARFAPAKTPGREIAAPLPVARA